MTQALEGHTVQRYNGELNSLHLRVLEMGGLVLDQVRHALLTLQHKDISIANTVLEREHQVDELEVGIDDDVITVIAKHAPVARDLRVITMGQLALDMLQESLQSFDSLDASRARGLVCRENVLDSEFQSSLRRLATFLLEDARNVGHAIHIVLMTKALERIGDHARNIAEYVIFMVLGEDVRHRLGSYCDTRDTPNGRTPVDRQNKD